MGYQYFPNIKKQQGITLVTSLVFLIFASIIGLHGLQTSRLNQVVHNKIIEHQAAIVVANAGLKLAKNTRDFDVNLCTLSKNQQTCAAIGNPQVIIRFKYAQDIHQTNNDATTRLTTYVYEISSTGRVGESSNTIVKNFVSQTPL